MKDSLLVTLLYCNMQLCEKAFEFRESVQVFFSQKMWIVHKLIFLILFLYFEGSTVTCLGCSEINIFYFFL